MDMEAYVKVLGALLVVLGLIAAASLVIRRFGLIPGAIALKPKNLRRLRIDETMTLDPRRRLVLLRHDDDEHLLLLGPDGDLLVSSKRAVDETPQ